MNGAARRIVVGMLVSVAVGCSGSPEDDELSEAAKDELRMAGVTSVRLARSRPGPSIAAADGSCEPGNDVWSIDFETRKLEGLACLSSYNVEVEKTLSAAQIERIREILLKLRVTRAPQSCPENVMVSTLSMRRATGDGGDYVNDTAVCGPLGAFLGTPVKEQGLIQLGVLLEELSAAATEADTGDPTPACVRTGCSGQICAEKHRRTTCEWKPEYACYAQAVCERDAGGRCAFRATPALAACLGQ